VAVALAIAGCTTPSAGVTPRAHPVETIKANLPADFEVQAYRGADDLGGERVVISQVLAQGKPVALNFFAGLCPPCRAEMPDLQEVHDSLGDRFVLVGVDVGPYTGLGTNDDGLQLVKELNITFPTGSTRDSQVVNRYRILGMPSTVFIKPDGKVMRKWDGALSGAKMRELVEQLIGASGG
jgi:thiol-disulfide isomerase/thioredoxin